MKNLLYLLLILTGCSSKHFYTGTMLDEKVSGEYLTFNIVNSDTGNELTDAENRVITDEIRQALQHKGMVYSPAGADLVVFFKYFQKKTGVIQQQDMYTRGEKWSGLAIRKTMPRSLVLQISDASKNAVVWGAYATDLPPHLNTRQYKSVVNSLIAKLKYEDKVLALHR